ncbi:iron-sulfur cluster-binding protein [Breznakiellaceae bacterium SP9]
MKSGERGREKRALLCRLLQKANLSPDIIQLEFEWAGPPPLAGQFFMLRPAQSTVLLGRPLSVAAYDTYNKSVSFSIAAKGKGIADFFAMHTEQSAELIGPLGNAWTDFLPQGAKRVVLVSGGIGIAPLDYFTAELKQTQAENAPVVDFYAGFKTSPPQPLLESARYYADTFVIATEDGSEGQQGFITAALDPAHYTAVFACGPQAMLKALAVKCAQGNTPCFISMERKMACGVGACLGCTIRTFRGNRRCCADGPIFSADEIIF